MKKFNCKHYPFLLAAAILLGSALTCSAQPYSGNQQWTSEQRAAAQQIFDENFADMDNIRQQLSDKRLELDAHLSSPNPDGAKIESLSREIGELRGQMLANRAKVRAQLRERGLSSDYYGPSHYSQHNGHGRNYDNWHHGDRRGYGPMGGCGCWW